MKQGRWHEAIDCYEDHVHEDGNDMEAFVELGFAYLLAGDRKKFEDVYRIVDVLLEKGAFPAFTGKAKAAWEHYCRLCSRAAVAAAIGTTLIAGPGLTGCRNGKDKQPVVSPADAQQEKEKEKPPEPEPEPEDKPKDEPDAKAQEPAAVEEKETGKDKEEYKPKMRYIARPRVN